MIYKFLVPKNLFLSFFFFFFFFFWRRLSFPSGVWIFLTITHTHTQFCRSGSFIHLYPFIYMCVCARLCHWSSQSHTQPTVIILRGCSFLLRSFFFFFLSCVSTTTYFRFMVHNFLLLFVDCCQLPSMCVNRLDTGGGGGAKIFRLETKNKQTLRLMIMPPSSL